MGEPRRTVVLKCPICQGKFEVFESRSSGRKTCSKSCMAELYRRIPKEQHPCWKGGKSKKICIICGKAFWVWPSKISQKACSSECAAKTKKPPVKLSYCRYCKKLFAAPEDHPNQVYCNNFCAKQSIRGNGSIHWRGGITPEGKRIRNSAIFSLWRAKVFIRDNWTCQRCGRRDGSELHPHHIKSFAEYPSLRFEVSNGITLCKDCHQEMHRHKLNRGNSTRALAELRKP